MYFFAMMKLTCSLLSILALSFATFSKAEETETINVSEFVFEFSSPWVKQQVTSQMRAGQLTYDHEDEKLKDVDLVFFYFGESNGGGTQANIDRWVGQFQGEPEKKIETKELGDREVTFLTATGTFLESSGGPFSGNKTPREDYTMLAAILPSDKGWVFLKLTGPSASVAAMKDAFIAVAESPFKE